jgi:hypothetical protein
MKINNPLAERFLTDPMFLIEIIREMFPAYDGSNGHPLESKVKSASELISPLNQRAYLITGSIWELLVKIKLKRKDNGHHDWTVFNHIKEQKVTLIFPRTNMLFRVSVASNCIYMSYVMLQDMAEVKFHFFYANKDGTLSENFDDNRVGAIEDTLYRLLCFFWLTQNDEVVLKPGEKKGTRKQGKLVNQMTIPITVVNSRWNTTVKVEGDFDVSAHFALRRCGVAFSETRLVYIDTYQKHGYTRNAKSETVKNNLNETTH